MDNKRAYENPQAAAHKCLLPHAPNQKEKTLMTKTQKLRTISYRISEESWMKIEREAEKTGETPHQWGRSAALEKLNDEHGLSRNERILFEQFARGQYLITQGFQLLADDKLTGEEWMKYRGYADQRTSEIVDRALALQAQRNGQSG
jgi:hypothetical protein